MSTDYEPVFESLPGNVPGTTGCARVWESRLRPLIGRVGEWARVGSSSKTAQRAARTASNLRRAALALGRIRIPPGRWEFAARTVDGEHRIYARYLGPAEDGDGV